MKTIDFATVIPKFDEALSRGLCNGVGKRNGQMCVEAAICYALDLPHGDDPGCVAVAVRAFKIALNDAAWSTPAARAEGLRDLGIAQLGSLGIVNDVQFATRLAAQTLEILIPELQKYVEYAAYAASAAKYVEYAASAAKYAAKYAASAAKYAEYAVEYAAKYAASAAKYAEYAVEYAEYAVEYAAKYAASDYFLRLSASLALEILIDMGSPGAAYISENAVAKLRQKGESK